jgi:RNA polymerase sigma factor (sigma-70 family)
MVDVLANERGEMVASPPVTLAGGLESPARRARAGHDLRRMMSVGQMSVADERATRSTARPASHDERADSLGADLVARIAKGEREALAALYRRHGEAVFSYVLSICPDRGLAEEVLQDTFVAVWRGAGSFEGRARVRTWLFGIARRQALGKLRRRGDEPTDPDELLAEPAPDPSPEEQALAAAGLERLTAAIGRLGPLQREIVTLAFVHQLSYAEMAAVLAVPIGTVRSRLAGARRRLARLIGEEEGR